MAGARVVTGPVVVLPEASTRLTRYYYQGSVLPDGLDEDRVQAAIDDGLVSEDVKAEELTAEDLSAAAAGDRLRAAGTISADSTPDAAADDDRPPLTANKDAWLAYRGLSDLTDEQKKDITKDQLQDDAYMASYQRPAPTA